MLIHLATIARSGRMYYRHQSNMGSVMMYFDDPELKYLRKVLILDAKYRSNQRFGARGIESENRWFNLTDSVFLSNVNNSDKRLISNNYPRDYQSSKVNCDNWMKLNSKKDKYSDRYDYIGVPAVSYCRSIFVDGVPCDLPNINILMRIWCDKETIDDLDPTIIDYPKYALSKKYNPHGDWNIGKYGSSGCVKLALNYLAWSSTGYSRLKCMIVNSGGYVSCIQKQYEFSVVPILELF